MIEVQMLASFQACPRERHLEMVFHVFAYLKKYNRSALVFDWTVPKLDESSFMEVDWKESYPGAKEAIPDNMPEPRGCLVNEAAFNGGPFLKV
jgi:hypothetical protein